MCTLVVTGNLLQNRHLYRIGRIYLGAINDAPTKPMRPGSDNRAGLGAINGAPTKPMRPGSDNRAGLGAINGAPTKPYAARI